MDWSRLDKLLFSHTTANTIWVAYSGGVDSHVLLHLCAEQKKQQPELAIKAIHINHHLSKQSDNWQQHCQTQCDRLNIPLIIKSVQCDAPKGESLEAYARTLRYKAIKETIENTDVVLTAHHKDDQAETLLLQCLRGSGPKGLAAMAEITDFSNGFLLRPLLQSNRQDLIEYAKQHDLSWIEDESNFDPKFRRNYLRHEVMPKLKQHWPGSSNTLARTSKLCAEADELLSQYAEMLITQCRTKQNTLRVSTLLELGESQQRLVLRHHIELLKYTLPSSTKLQSIINNLLLAKEDATPYVEWKGVEIRRYNDELYVMYSQTEHDITQIIPWDLVTPLEVDSIDRILTSNDLPDQLDKNGGYTIRFRQGGETIMLNPAVGHQQLKKLFQEWNIPPWQRDRIPLLYRDEELVAVLR